MTNSFLSFVHAWNFCIDVPFSGRSTFFLPPSVIFVRNLSLHSRAVLSFFHCDLCFCYTSSLVTAPCSDFFTHYLHVGDLKLIFLLHHDLIVLSYSSGVLLGLRKRCGLFSCSLFWGSFVLFLYPYQVHLVAFTGDGNMKQQC